MKLEEYFTDDKIIRLLCKYRVKSANNRHKNHLFAEISLSRNTKRKKSQISNYTAEINSLLPPRRQWKRPNKEERIKYNDSQKITVKAIINTIKSTHRSISFDPVEKKPSWYIKLHDFISEIKESVKTPTDTTISPPIIKAIKKEEKKDCLQCRPLSIYDLKSRIIVSLTARYFTDLFDPFFLPCSYAFRSTKRRSLIISHHDAIKDILNYKNNQSKSVWASECDIKKFFDCVSHEVVLDSLHKTIKDHEIELDEKALILFKSYLNSYSFTHDVFTKNYSDYFENNFLAGCYFPWPAEDLLINFYETSDIRKERIGVPQGGAISCFIANLLMNDVDKAVTEHNTDGNLLYIRFCDDMIILHPEKNQCQEALNSYEKAIFKQKLLTHRAQNITEYNKSFWSKDIKSKSPYKWEQNNKLGNIPWLSFVGYQIRFDGLVRVRKQSIEKEITKQRNEIHEILKSLDQKINNYYPDDKGVNINNVSRKSIRQQVHAAHNRLISMSVGRIKLHNRDEMFGLCWTNGFKALTYNPIIKSQLKRLDRSRSKHLFLLKRRLSGLTTKPSNVKHKNAMRYYGAPFSYYYFIHKLNKD